MYKVEWEKETLKELAKIDRLKAEKIRQAIENILAKDLIKKASY